MLAPSRLYSFLDHKSGFNIHFLEGQKLIHDLVLMHPMTGSGFSYLRDTFLGILPIIFFLKPGETIGVYIDSEDPYFRLKIETSHSGQTRCLLLPEDMSIFPMTVTGNMRITKVAPSQKVPYTSVIEMQKVDTRNLINQIFAQSYQTDSEVHVSDICDQSVMITKLPPLNGNVVVNDSVTRENYIKKYQPFFNSVFEKATDDIEVIVKTFEDNGWGYLGSRQITFACPCSQERMLFNLKGMYQENLEELFQGQDEINLKCDYCRKNYKITKNDFIKS